MTAIETPVPDVRTSYVGARSDHGNTDRRERDHGTHARRLDRDHRSYDDGSGREYRDPLTDLPYRHRQSSHDRTGGYPPRHTPFEPSR